MQKKYLPTGLFIFWLLPFMFHMNCAVPLSEIATGDDEVINSHKKQIDYGLTWKTAMEDIETVKGKVVKWDGWLVRIWDDKIQVFGRGREEFTNNFVATLDHPLPTETGIGDLTQTVSVGKTVWIVGKIIDQQVYVTRDGVNMTVPVLKCLMISRDNDRDFSNPVWITKE